MQGHYVRAALRIPSLLRGLRQGSPVQGQVRAASNQFGAAMFCRSLDTKGAGVEL